MWVAESAAQAGYDCLLLGYAHARPKGRFSAKGFTVHRIARRTSHSERFLEQLSEALPAIGALFKATLGTLIARAEERQRSFPGGMAIASAPFTKPPKASLSERITWHTRGILHGRWPKRVRSPEPSHEWHSLLQQRDHQLAWMMSHVLSSAEQLDSQLAGGKPPDLVHCHDLDTLLVGALAKRRWGIPIVWDSHENWPYINPEADGEYIRTFLELERLLAGHADHVFAVSSPLLREITARTGARSISVVPNAEIWRGERPPTTAGAMTALAAGRIRFLFQGSFAPERGLDHLIAAWRGVDGRRAALFLRGPRNEAAEKLEARASELGLLNEAVYFLDPVVEEELVAASSEADVGLIPYLRRWPGYRVACPNKLSQYLHAGVPVLSNELPYVREILQAGRCGAIYDSTVHGSLEALVATVVANPQLLADWRRNALGYSREQFNWQRVSPEIISRYAQLLDSAPVTARGSRRRRDRWWRRVSRSRARTR